MPKIRLDVFLVRKGFAETIEKAQKIIQSGQVYDNAQKLDKAGTPIDAQHPIYIKKNKKPWASRGGTKLQFAIETANIDVTDKTCLDIGTNVGGFTDVLLAKNARKVYAIDTDYGRIDWRLRQNAKVILIERFNARYVTDKQIAEPLDLIVCDASFIRLSTVLPAAMRLASAQAIICALIKPQFEAAKKDVTQQGCLKNPALYAHIVKKTVQWMNQQKPWQTLKTLESPITLPHGNKEYFIIAQKMS